MSDIVRVHGETGVRCSASDDVRHAVFTWAWLLPRTGNFSFADLARAIRSSYCTDNPKTAHDLKALEEVYCD